MKKYLFVLFSLIYLNVYSQNKEGHYSLIDCLKEKTKLEITFVSYVVIKEDSIQINQILYYDKINKKEVNLRKNEIYEMFPNISKGITITSHVPFRSASGRNIE